jgi:cell division protein FtsB
MYRCRGNPRDKWGYRKQIIHHAITGETMQPDLLSAQREEVQPEAVSPQELTQAESRSMPVPESAPPEPDPVDETVKSIPSSAKEKRRLKLNIAVIGLSLLLFLLLLSFGWVGYWAYTLNTELTASQGQLMALQANYDKLQADYTALTSENEKLNAELTQSKANLEKTNTDLTAARGDLSESMQRGENLDAQIDRAGKLAEVLFVWNTMDNPSDIFKLDTLINETNDKDLISQWNTFTRSPSDEALGGFLDYLILTIRNSLR